MGSVGSVCGAIYSRTILAIPFCDVAEKALGIKDDGRITADEWMLYPIALVGIPLAALPWLFIFIQKTGSAAGFFFLYYHRQHL